MSEVSKQIAAVKPPEVKRVATSKAQQALEALQKIEGLKAEAISELLAERAKIDEQLEQLGYENGGGSSKKRAGTRNTDPSKKYCNICEMSGHDGRAHRSQGEKKKKFTAEELRELNAKTA